jgi:AraC family ethanolamine operon transcriptional activator
VRRELRDADSGRTSVTGAATHWGFFHSGQFSAAYHKVFGELPSATLNKGRGSLRDVAGPAAINPSIS